MTYTNTNSLKLKIVVIAVRCDGRDNTKKLCNFISIVVPLKKTVVGYIDLKQQETYEKLRNRG